MESFTVFANASQYMATTHFVGETTVTHLKLVQRRFAKF